METGGVILPKPDRWGLRPRRTTIWIYKNSNLIQALGVDVNRHLRGMVSSTIVDSRTPIDMVRMLLEPESRVKFPPHIIDSIPKNQANFVERLRFLKWSGFVPEPVQPSLRDTLRHSEEKSWTDLESLSPAYERWSRALQLAEEELQSDPSLASDLGYYQATHSIVGGEMYKTKALG